MLSGTPRTFIGSTTFTVRGLTGLAGRRSIVERLGQVAGVDSVTVDLVSGVVSVKASQLIDRADIAAAVETLGFAVVP
jgi:copper chaperone CopZ